MIRNRMEVKIKQAFIVHVGSEEKICGLGENSKVYYLTSKGWKLLSGHETYPSPYPDKHPRGPFGVNDISASLNPQVTQPTNQETE